MVGDTQVLVSTRYTRLDQLANRILPIAPGGMNVQNATQIALLHQYGQRAVERGLNLSHVFTQFRLDIGHT